MDNTTTDEPILPDAEEPSAQSEQVSDTTAAPEPAEPTSSNDAQEPAAEENADNSGGQDNEFASLKEWADKKGYDLTTEDGQARAWKSLREAEKRMHESTAKASQLEKTLTTAEPAQGEATDGTDDTVGQLAAEVQNLKMTQNVNMFFAQNPDAKALEATMSEIVTQRPEVGQLVRAGYLSVADLYNLARGSDTSHDERLKADGGREALEKVASKQQAKAFVGTATTSDMSVSKPDPFLESFDKN